MIRTGPRVDLPPLDQFGPWPQAEIGDGLKMVPRRSNSEIVRDMKLERELPRDVCAGELVPQRVREHYADLWRMEQEDLEADEAHRLSRTWRFRLRRLIYRITGKVEPAVHHLCRPRSRDFRG